MRRCLFCTNSANSLEDAWPHWITDQYRGARAVEVDAVRGGVRLKPWSKYQPELKVRCVCRTCNNGWMSGLESRAQPLLQPMLIGSRIGLDLAGQATVALWSVKTAAVLDGMDQVDRRAYSLEECERMRTLSAVTWRTSVWLAASATASHFMSTKNRHLGSNDLSGVSITIALGHVVLQVLTIRIPDTFGPDTLVTTDARTGPWEEVTTQIWPARSQTAVWPPSLGLNGEVGLDALADRFIAAEASDADITPLAI